MLYWITCVFVYLNESQVHLWLPDLWCLWGKRPEYLNDVCWPGCSMRTLVLELVIALKIMSLIISVSLWPLGFLQRAFLSGRAWKSSFSLSQWALCAGCALFTLQQLFMGSVWHLASEVRLIHFLPTAISLSLGSCLEHTRAVLLLYRVMSVTCWHSVDVSERLALSWLSCETRKRAPEVCTSVVNSRYRAVTWGWGGDLTTLEIPLGRIVQNVLSPNTEQLH